MTVGIRMTVGRGCPSRRPTNTPSSSSPSNSSPNRGLLAHSTSFAMLRQLRDGVHVARRAARPLPESGASTCPFRSGSAHKSRACRAPTRSSAIPFAFSMASFGGVLSRKIAATFAPGHLRKRGWPATTSRISAAVRTSTGTSAHMLPQPLFELPRATAVSDFTLAKSRLPLAMKVRAFCSPASRRSP